MRRKQELQKKGKKGFTLVELIVVIVILGILAAIAVPALIGYIQKASDDGAITEAATARTAMQTVISSATAHGGEYKDPDGNTFTLSSNSATDMTTCINYLTGTSGANEYEVNNFTQSVGILTSFEITVPSSTSVVSWNETDGYTVTPVGP